MKYFVLLVILCGVIVACDSTKPTEPDTQPPFIAWINPPDSLFGDDFVISTDTITIEFNVGDNGGIISGIEIYLGGTIVQSLAAAPFRTVLDLSVISINRSARIYATATDPSGNVGSTADTLTFVRYVEPDTATWTSLSFTGSSPTPLENHSFTLDASNRRALMFGGLLAFTGASTNVIWAFNLDADTWEILSTSGVVPEPRSRHGAQVVGDSLVVLGGMREEIPDSIYADYALLSLATLSWNANRYILGGRNTLGMGTASSAGTAYFYGGVSDVGGSASDSLWSYTHAGGWVLVNTAPNNPGGRVYAATTFDVESNRFFLVGGTETDGMVPGNDGSFFLFDIGSTNWQSAAAPGPLPTQKAEVVYDSLNNRLLLWGGSDNTGALSTDLWQFSLGARRWQRVPTNGPLPSARTGHRMVMDAPNSRFIMIGGTVIAETWELRW